MEQQSCPSILKPLLNSSCSFKVAEKSIPCGLNAESYKKLKESTGLSDDDLDSRYQEFTKNFPDGVITYNEFRDLSAQVLEPTEVEAFCRNVFRMFDSNKDLNLTFDEFTVATTAKDSSPAEKLAWLFDHVYDKVKSVFKRNFKTVSKGCTEPFKVLT